MTGVTVDRGVEVDAFGRWWRGIGVPCGSELMGSQEEGKTYPFRFVSGLFSQHKIKSSYGSMGDFRTLVKCYWVACSLPQPQVP